MRDLVFFFVIAPCNDALTSSRRFYFVRKAAMFEAGNGLKFRIFVNQLCARRHGLRRDNGICRRESVTRTQPSSFGAVLDCRQLYLKRHFQHHAQILPRNFFVMSLGDAGNDLRERHGRQVKWDCLPFCLLEQSPDDIHAGLGIE